MIYEAPACWRIPGVPSRLHIDVAHDLATVKRAARTRPRGHRSMRYAYGVVLPRHALGNESNGQYSACLHALSQFTGIPIC